MQTNKLLETIRTQVHQLNDPKDPEDYKIYTEYKNIEKSLKSFLALGIKPAEICRERTDVETMVNRFKGNSSCQQYTEALREEWIKSFTKK
ncbi:MAG: hypothetical protein BGO07_00230 [Alphaproteobacteria bacterium 40-19]|nr:MAG: hypothetical protein BGO07_00230 [Alphaproteobacteria bacterium 40-19]